MRFQGKFINEKGEEITRWADFPSVDAFKEHLKLKGWQIVECKEVGVAKPAFWEVSSPSYKICSSCNEKNNPQFSACYICKSPLVGGAITPEYGKGKSAGVQNIDSKSMIFIVALIFSVVVLLFVIIALIQMKNDMARNMSKLQNQMESYNFAMRQQGYSMQQQAQQQQLTNALVMGDIAQQQMKQ
jgi:hypothetical protein